MLRIGFAYNEKPPEDDEPPGIGSHDRFAEWDDPDTIDAIASALGCAGEVVRLEADVDFPLKLRDARPDIVFNIAEGVHGPNREAHVPAICEFYGIPYTGSDPLALSLALDKRRAKEVFLARGVPTPGFVVIGDPLPVGPPSDRTPSWSGSSGSIAEAAECVSLPAIVKPLFEGSSKGIPVNAYCETVDAVRRRTAEIVAEYGQPALVEEFLPGREFTCAIVGNGVHARTLPLVEVRFDALPAGVPPIYGYEAKWLWDTPDRPLEIFACPAGIEPELADALETAALGAYRALGCRDWARIDLRVDAAGRPAVIEVNPLPGVLPDPRQNSCFPKAARAAGLDYDAMILAVLNTALQRYGIEP